MNLRVSLITAAMVLALQGCGGKTTEEDIEQLKELQTNQALWQSQDIDDYSFTLIRECFCIPAGRINISVEDGEVVGAYSELEERELTEEELGYFAATVPAMFEWLQETIVDIDRDIEIEYDDELGYPARVAIEEDQLVSDAGIVLTITEFEVE